MTAVNFEVPVAKGDFQVAADTGYENCALVAGRRPSGRAHEKNPVF